MVTWYLLSVVLSALVMIGARWLSGDDLCAWHLALILLAALLPVFNVVVTLVCFISAALEIAYKSPGKVILPGRK